MTRFASKGMAVMALLLAGASAGWCQQYFLYSPTAVNNGQAESKDGVMVQEVQVQKGDTLYGISRKFSGHGMYYPQILLFNAVKDPSKIYPGDVLKIPVSSQKQVETPHPAPAVKQGAAASRSDAPQQASRKDMSVKAVPSTPAAIELSTSDLKKSDTIREKKREAKKKTDSGTAHAENAEKRSTTPVAGRYAAKVSQSQPDAISSQKLFEQAVKAYRQEDYRSALGLFDRFLADNPSSALAPDASLYKAECYMKLASQ